MKNDFLLSKFLWSEFSFFLQINWGFFGLWTDRHCKVSAHIAHYNLGTPHSHLHCSCGEIEAAGSWMSTTSQTWSKSSSTDQGENIYLYIYNSRSFKSDVKNISIATSKSVGHGFKFSWQIFPLRFMLSLWNSQYRVLTTFAKRTQISYLARHHSVRFLMGSAFLQKFEPSQRWNRLGYITKLDRPKFSTACEMLDLQISYVHTSIYGYERIWMNCDHRGCFYISSTKRAREREKSHRERERTWTHLFIKNHQGEAFKSKACVFHVSNLFSSRLCYPLESE